MGLSRRWGLRIGALGLGLGLLVACELGLRRLAPVESRMELFPVHGAGGAVALGQVLDLEDFLDRVWTLFERDRGLIWRLRPGLAMEASGLSIAPDAPPWRLSTDGAGRRGGGAQPGADLVALGDSSTFGWGVNDAQTWPALAGGVNLGVPGYSSAQGLALAARRLPALAPRALVLAFGANDGHYTPWPDRALLADRATLWGGLGWRLSGLQLVRRLRNLIYTQRLDLVVGRYRAGETQPRVSPQAMAENLEATAALAPGASVLLLDVCARDEYRQAMDALAERAGYALLRYRGQTLDGCHPDAAGQRWIAQRVRAALSG